jgi:hypothetical protein
MEFMFMSAAASHTTVEVKIVAIMQLLVWIEPGEARSVCG